VNERPIGAPRNEEGESVFVWPPAIGRSGHQSEQRAAGRCVVRQAGGGDETRERMGWVESVERTWLGLAVPAFGVRATAAGWSPDPRGSYCARCGTTVGPFEARESREDGRPGGCPACSRTRPPWERVVRLGTYEGLLRDAIHEVKFGRWRRLGSDLGRLLGGAILREMDEAGLSGMPLRYQPNGSLKSEQFEPRECFDPGSD
jgi:hypothetical protein